MDWIQTLTIIGINIALFAALATLVIWTINKLDADIKSLGNRLDGHASRIDHIYEVFLQERKDNDLKFAEIQRNMDQKFYDLLKESKK